jgi:chitinase
MVLVGIGSSIPWRVRAGAVLGLVLLAVLALAAAAAARSGAGTPPAPGRLVDSRQAGAAAALGTNWYESAPYYLTLDSQAPDLAQVMPATGQKAFVLSFILDGGGCTPTWDGTSALSDASVAAVVSAVRAGGGDVSVSAGGYNGNKLGQGCGSAAATAGAYQRVISAYGLHAMDFDLEEPEIENAGAIANELGAAQILQRNNPGLFVSVTMPASPSGANYFGQLLLNQAKSLGFTPDDYSIMPFDNGFSGGASQVSALRAFNSQLMSTFGWSSATAYQHEGFSGMNGRSDTGEMFSTGDFQTVLGFAQSSGMTRYTFWSENRDRQCSPPDNNGRTSADCSSVAQNAGDFTAYTVRFAGGTPGHPPPPPTPPPPGSCAAPWSATQIYVGGNQASFNGHDWTARWWTQGDVPGGQTGVWADDGPCSGGGGPSPSPRPSATPTPAPTPSRVPTPTPAPSATPSGTCAAAWSSSQVYVGGDRASYHGHNWTAKWWTENDVPGGAAGVWADGGPCT